MARRSSLFIKIDPQVTHMPQAALVPPVTSTTDGAMTPELLALLLGLVTQSGGAFQRVISQPADGTDFIVAIPTALQLGTANYQPVCSIMTPNTFTGIAFELASQTSTQFRVTTDGTLPDGTVLLFSLKKVA